MDRRRRKRMERYWARAEAKARAAVDRLDPESWFDLWHTHLDWDGRGRASVEDRQMVNAVAVRVLCYLEKRLAHRGAAVQLWADLNSDTMDTGIYAHSANLNGTTFPATHRAGIASCDGSVRYVVQRQPAMVGAEVRQ
ncbi:hypothetical protein [Xanthomonas sp. 10-10]|uniref:Uncharacterized protein n=1 Tax=Xanthomonas sp. 10-10 TaxID=3115848 RepID=A0AAU7P887_9XANT